MVLGHEITTLKEVDISEANITLRSDEIIHVHFKKNTTLDIDLQLKLRNIYKDLIGNKKTKFLFSAEEGFTLTKEARENSKSLNKDSPIMAYAIIANNLAYRIIANFFLRVNKPEVSYKLFPNVEDAVKWLYNL